MLPTRRGKITMAGINPINRQLIAETGVIPAGMQLIRDTHAFNVLDTKNVVVEGRDGSEEPALRVTGLFQEGDTENANGRVYGTSDVLAPAVESIQTDILHRLPCGACLRGLFEHKIRVGISSRGVGDMEVVESHGQEKYKVMPGYSFVTWDAVAEPSVNGAILNIQEGLNRKIRPIQKVRSKFDKVTYERMLVKEINNYFDLK